MLDRSTEATQSHAAAVAAALDGSLFILTVAVGNRNKDLFMKELVAEGLIMGISFASFPFHIMICLSNFFVIKNPG